MASKCHPAVDQRLGIHNNSMVFIALQLQKWPFRAVGEQRLLMFEHHCLCGIDRIW